MEVLVYVDHKPPAIKQAVQWSELMGRKQRGVTAVSPALKQPTKEAVAEKTPQVTTTPAPVAVVEPEVVDPYAGLSNSAKGVAQAFDALSMVDQEATLGAVTRKTKLVED